MLVGEAVARGERRGRVMREGGARCRLRLRWRGEGLCLGGGIRLWFTSAVLIYDEDFRQSIWMILVRE